MLHWKITNRGFALWRVPGAHKAPQLQGRGTGRVNPAQTKRFQTLRAAGCADSLQLNQWPCKARSEERAQSSWWAIPPSTTHWISGASAQLVPLLLLILQRKECLPPPPPSQNKSQVGESLISLLCVSKRSPGAGDLYSPNVITNTSSSANTWGIQNQPKKDT